jgi:beta-glucosidase
VRPLSSLARRYRRPECNGSQRIPVFSFAWTRLIPDGKGAINDNGIAFYDRLIDDLLSAGIEPYATLYHWDLPQALQDRGGWYNRETAEHFAAYAAVATRAFGDRVKKWTTLNEPWTFCWSGYASGEDAPGFNDGTKGGVIASHHAVASPWSRRPGHSHRLYRMLQSASSSIST